MMAISFESWALEYAPPSDLLFREVLNIDTDRALLEVDVVIASWIMELGT